MVSQGEKSQGTNKVSRIHPLGTMKIGCKCQDCMDAIAVEILQLDQKRWTIAIPGSTPPALET